MVAGPNGSGKSSLYDDKNIDVFDQSVWIINPDILTERIRQIEKLDPRAANVEAVVRVEAWLEASIRAHQTVGVETVLSTDKYRRLVRLAKEKQFEFRLIFVMLEAPDLNVKRVQIRAKKGGHDVAEEKIRERWNKSLTQLPWFIEQADWAVIYDNSAATLREIGFKKDGEVYIDSTAPAALRAAIDAAKTGPS
jgi:predicted ABC-type ATPase